MGEKQSNETAKKNGNKVTKKRVSSFSMLIILLIIGIIIYLVIAQVTKDSLKDIIPTTDENVESEEVQSVGTVIKEDERLSTDFSTKQVDRTLNSDDGRFTVNILKDGTATVKVNKYRFLENIDSIENKAIYEEIFENIKKERAFSVIDKNIIDVLYPYLDEEIKNIYYSSRDMIVVKCSDTTYYYVDVTSSSADKYVPLVTKISELDGKNIKQYKINKNNQNVFITSDNDEIKEKE